MKIEGIYLVTEKFGAFNHLIVCRLALKGGVRIIQYREKQESTRVMVEEAREIRKLTRDYNALFIVNDRVDVALFSEADGVHVGQKDASVSDIRKFFGSRFIVGVSVRTVEEALLAEKEGADYVAVSPVFDTTTKEDAEKGVGLESLKVIAESVRIPVVAIGGINKDNLASVIKSGANAVAVVSAITRSNDPEKAARELVETFNNLKGR